MTTRRDLEQAVIAAARRLNGALEPTGDGGTRLVTRLRIHYDWHRPGEALLSLILNEFGDFPMMRRMLLGIKARAESPKRGSWTS